ncbi:MAG: glycerol acyltransferase [Aeromicrobium sp.]|nr:MAG: glycerol acyltransferase [Aeromicrobium sp.]
MLLRDGVVVASGQYLRKYHGWQSAGELTPPAEPTLFVSHHGFGSLFDLNVFAALASLHEMGVDRPVTLLAHQLAWRIGVGPIFESLGAQPASHSAAREAFAQGDHALVMPGGDVDGFKPHRDRNRIVFDGRTGFAQLAIDTGVRVVPIVTSGAGDTIYSLSDGRWLARALGLDRVARLKAIPMTVSIPWGFNIGLVGFAPHLPLPVKLSTRVLPEMRPSADEDANAFAERVRAVMQATLTELTEQD